MVNPLLSSLFNLRAHLTEPKRAAVVVDVATGLTVAEYARCLRPWSSVVSVNTAVHADRASVAALAVAVPWARADVLVAVTSDDEFTRAARGLAASRDTTFVDSRVPADGSRDLALFQEVLHHDYELGGYNDWISGDSQFGASVVRSLSVTNCRMSYPSYMDARLDELRRARGSRSLDALDVGCGALSRLRWGALRGVMTVTGVDPLLDMYAIIRERHGLGALPHIACARDVVLPAELLHTRLPAASFDFAYCANALDHTENPVAVVEALAAVMRPGGLLAIEVFTREGSREQWWQLHQFDMYIDDTRGFVCQTRDGGVRDLFPRGAGFTLREVVVNSSETTCVVAARTS